MFLLESQIFKYIFFSQVDGLLTNTGFGLQWIPSPEEPRKISTSSQSSPPVASNRPSSPIILQPKNRFMISGGPLFYKYTLSYMAVRWSTNQKGSEHFLEGQAFPAEVSIGRSLFVLFAKYK